jgi:hypothetical protein
MKRWYRIPLERNLWTVFAVLFSFFVPLVFACTIAVIVNSYRILAWLYVLIFGPRWDQRARIAADLGVLSANSMRIQTVGGAGNEHFILVTSSKHYQPALNINPLPTLSSAQFAALLETLDLKDSLTALAVEANCMLNFPGLLALIYRHQSLHQLTLQPGAIHPASLTLESPFPANVGRITSLISPGMYITYILRTEHYIEDLTITSAADGS